jgi:hypothetical protein
VRAEVTVPVRGNLDGEAGDVAAARVSSALVERRLPVATPVAAQIPPKHVR